MMFRLKMKQLFVYAIVALFCICLLIQPIAANECSTKCSQVRESCWAKNNAGPGMELDKNVCIPAQNDCLRSCSSSAGSGSQSSSGFQSGTGPGSINAHLPMLISGSSAAGSIAGSAAKQGNLGFALGHSLGFFGGLGAFGLGSNAFGYPLGIGSQGGYGYSAPPSYNYGYPLGSVSPYGSGVKSQGAYDYQGRWSSQGDMFGDW